MPKGIKEYIWTKLTILQYNNFNIIHIDNIIIIYQDDTEITRVSVHFTDENL